MLKVSSVIFALLFIISVILTDFVSRFVSSQDKQKCKRSHRRSHKHSSFEYTPSENEIATVFKGEEKIFAETGSSRYNYKAKKIRSEDAKKKKKITQPSSIIFDL